MKRMSALQALLLACFVCSQAQASDAEQLMKFPCGHELKENSSRAGGKLSVTTSTEHTNKFCEQLGELVETRKIRKCLAYSVHNDPNDDDYSNLDIDLDGLADKVHRSCGSGSEASECLLTVQLSSGSEFDIDGGIFYLVNIDSNIYAVFEEVNKETGKHFLLELLQLTAKGAAKICGKKD